MIKTLTSRLPQQQQQQQHASLKQCAWHHSHMHTMAREDSTQLQCCSRSFASAPDHALCVYSLKLYNNLVERCFTECVSEFRRRELDVGEEKVLYLS